MQKKKKKSPNQNTKSYYSSQKKKKDWHKISSIVMAEIPDAYNYLSRITH